MNTIVEKGFRLNDREIRPVQGEVSGPDGVRHLPPKVMQVLVCLAEQPGRVIPRSEILDRVWGHRDGSDKSLTRCISELRQALDDRRGNGRLIETIPKRGYRLLATASTLDSTDDGVGESPKVSEKLSIAVLPFKNMSSDPDQEYFSDGITEDITTELSRNPGLFVIARNSAFSFKGQPSTIEEISERLRVRYLLQGSVRRASDRIRVTAQLTDTENRREIWAERYDRNLTDIFAVQDDLTRQIVSVLAVTLTPESLRQNRRRLTGNLDAYEYVLRGRELAWLHKRETGDEARRLLARAIWLDPGYAAAYCWLAFSHVIEYVNQWPDEPDESLRIADELAAKAVNLDDSDAQAHFVLGECYLWARRDHEAAIQEGRRAIDLDPNYSHAYLLLGHALHYAGCSQESLEPYEKARRIRTLRSSAVTTHGTKTFQAAVWCRAKARPRRHPTSSMSG